MTPCDPELEQHRGGDLARERALRLPRACSALPHARPSRRALLDDGAQRGERRADRRRRPRAVRSRRGREAGEERLAPRRSSCSSSSCRRSAGGACSDVGLHRRPSGRSARHPERLHTGQRLALQQLQRGAAAGGDVRHRSAGRTALDRGGRVAAADHRGRLRAAPSPRRPLACRPRTARSRTRPSGRSRTPCRPAAISSRVGLRGARADVEAHPAVRARRRRRSRAAARRRRSGRRARGRVAARAGSSTRAARSQRSARQLDALLLDQRVAGRPSLRAKEAEAHGAADQDRVGDARGSAR